MNEASECRVREILQAARVLGINSRLENFPF